VVTTLTASGVVRFADDYLVNAAKLLPGMKALAAPATGAMPTAGPHSNALIAPQPPCVPSGVIERHYVAGGYPFCDRFCENLVDKGGDAGMSGDAIEQSGDMDAPLEVKRTAEVLLPLFYEDVRRAARRERRRVGAGQTMQTTALIHEAYLKLNKSGGFNDQAHFLRAAALAMRHALINYARDRVVAKRGGGVQVLPLEYADEVGTPADEELLEINEALVRLAALSPRLAQVVECRFFGGYGDEETAAALGLTDRTVRRDWIKARAWLKRELANSGAETAL